jgi:hypothetical protein
MEKVISPHAWDFGVPATELIKFSSRGLRGSDLTQLIKRAGHEFADRLRDLRLPEGVVPAHLIAVGSTERYGPNRNGDGFKIAACQKYHDTFVKHAKPYRHHQNRSPSPHYGVVKESYFNEPMSRIELLLLYNGDAKTAAENGGLIADQEIEKLANGRDLPHSMACLIPFDSCSSCGNKAPSRAQYCTEDTCSGPHGEKRGGVRDNMMKVCEDGHVLHVDNPDPDFFDISMVTRPADRIAFGARADYLQKAASGHIFSGAELAEQWGVVTLPGSLVVHGDVVGELARLEQQLAIKTAADISLARALKRGSVILPQARGQEERERWAQAAMDSNVLLPLTTIASWFHSPQNEKFAELIESAETYLPGIFGRAALDHNYLNPTLFRTPRLAPSSSMLTTMSKFASVYGLDEFSLRDRVSRSIIEQWPVPAWRQPILQKQATVTLPGEQLARHYASYQLAWLSKLSADLPEFALTSRACVLQNSSIAP